MDSENRPVVAEAENKEKKQGLTVLGYVVPWWAIIVVILVVLYFAYERGYIAGVLGDAFKATPVKEVELKGPVQVVSALSAPEEVKKLFIASRMF